MVFAQPCSSTHLVSLVFLLLLIHVEASASGNSQPLNHQWQENPEVVSSEAVGWFLIFFPLAFLSSGDFEAAADLACWEQTKSGEAVDSQIFIKLKFRFRSLHFILCAFSTQVAWPVFTGRQGSSKCHLTLTLLDAGDHTFVIPRKKINGKSCQFFFFS